MKKIAFYGNSCTGKTSSMYELCAYLTKQGKTFRTHSMPFDSSGSTKNKKPFAADKLEESVYSRYYFLFDQLKEESYQKVINEYDYFISEMTALDLLYFCQWVGELTKNEESTISEMVWNWMKTYDKVYYMLDSDFYFFDGARFNGTKIKDALSKYYIDNHSYASKAFTIVDCGLEERAQFVKKDFIGTML